MSDFIEGGALNAFDNKKDYEGKNFKARNKYQILEFQADNLIHLKILEIPNYIKIDVDGNEHIVLEGMKTILSSKNVKQFPLKLMIDTKNTKKCN